MRRLVHRTCAVAACRKLSEAQTIRPVHKFEQFARIENEAYIQELLTQFTANPASVDSAWWPVLEALEQGSMLSDVPIVKGFSRPKGGSKVNEVDEARIDALKLAWLVRSFEQKGHLVAELDPLGMFDADLSPVVPPELQPSFFGFGEHEMDKTFRLQRDEKGFTDGQNCVTLREIVAELKGVYCSAIGYEYTHLRSQEEQNWLRDRILHPETPVLKEVDLLDTLVRAERFEHLFHRKFTTAKRFGSEGAEALIPLLRVLLDKSADFGFENAIFSMAHRGRLNILHNVLGKELDIILNEFKGYTTPDNINNLGDVKYHLGHNANIKTIGGKPLGVRMLANPSHLECVAPVSQGVVKAMQTTARNKQNALHVVLHGDAAYSGQGVCFETMAMAELESFGVDGTVHVITNNQIGFTTNPAQSRSAAYCSDLAKLNSIPVFHVNGDRPEAVIRVAQLAAEYRALFKRDVIIDLVCYRRNGHNENDEPRITQPLMYKTVTSHLAPSAVYFNALMAQSKIQEPAYEALKNKWDSHYNEIFNQWETKLGSVYVPKKWVDPVDPVYPETAELQKQRETGVDVAQIKKVGAHLASLPADFVPHKNIAPVLTDRLASFESGQGVKWSAAEQLAFATLMQEGHGIRLSGQDVERGTFSTRHFNVHDVKTGNKYMSLANVPEVNVPITIKNSLLSEFAVSGFEMGYSMERLNDLVIWEAQYGDFANGAQIIWDNFLSGCEVKWGDKCALVVSLPHGFDGQGPEHSSARIERFLQLEGSSELLPADFEAAGVTPYHAMETRIRNGNWQVTYPTTAANYFHLLRRQLKRDFRKPLINFFSKSNLRADDPRSNIDELATGQQFRPVIDQTQITRARRVVFCSGQVNLTLRTAQAAGNHSDVAIVRLEQIAPFPWEQVAQLVDKYRSANPDVEFAWAQEEPRNMGCWNYVRPRFRSLLVQRGYSLKQASAVRYIGRDANGSPATGYGFIHKAEVDKILSETFSA